MLEGVHDEDGEAKSENVGQETGVEVGPAVLLQAAATWENGSGCGQAEARGPPVARRTVSSGPTWPFRLELPVVQVGTAGRRAALT